MIFDHRDWRALADLFKGRFGNPNGAPYAGYKPEVREAPNGDGVIDAAKRYLHVALKYNPPQWARVYLAQAHFEACRVAEAMGVDPRYYPRVADGTLRVLDYPAGAGTARHTDFDLFTIVCYRSTPDDLWMADGADAGPGSPSPRDLGRAINPGLHIGEIGELCGLGPATPHSVPARPYRQQSIVYFAMPDHAAHLPGVHENLTEGPTVGEWLKERIARSRY